MRGRRQSETVQKRRLWYRVVRERQAFLPVLLSGTVQEQKQEEEAAMCTRSRGRPRNPHAVMYE